MLHRGVEAFLRLGPAWCALETGETAPFQRVAWARAWLASYGEGLEPWILTLGDPVEAIFPLALDARGGLRTLRFLGHGPSDYLGSIPLDASSERWAAFGRALAAESSRFDLLDLESLFAPDEARHAFAVALDRPYAERAYERCPVIDTTGSWEDYLVDRKKKFRANLKRADRRVEEHGKTEVARERVTTTLFDALVDVERESWKWKAGTAMFRDPRARKLLARVLLEDPVPHELWTLRIAGDLAGFAIVFRSDSVRFYYLPSFRERYPDCGTKLLADLTRASFGDEIVELDFLRGDEGYKLAWTHRERTVHQLAVAGRSLRGRVALAALRTRWRLARSERARAIRERLLALRRQAPVEEESTAR